MCIAISRFSARSRGGMQAIPTIGSWLRFGKLMIVSRNSSDADGERFSGGCFSPLRFLFVGFLLCC